MTSQNNLYNILAAFNNATKPAEVETPKQQAQKIYESVEAKGSIIGGVKGVEKKLGEAFAAHKVAEEKDVPGYADWHNARQDKKDKSAANRKNTKDAQKAKIDSVKKVKEGKMGQLDADLKDSSYSDADFKKKYGKSKADMKNSMSGKKDEKKVAEGKFTHNAKTGAKLNPRTGEELPAKEKPVTMKQMFATPKAPAQPKLTLNDVWRQVEHVIGQIFPDGDPIDWMGPWLQKRGYKDFQVGDIINRAARKNGYKDMYAYYDELKQQHADDQSYGESMGEAAGDDIQWYDQPDGGDTTTDTDTGRIHKAGRGGYGNKVDDEAPMALPAGQVARGRGRPKNLAGELKRQAAAARAEKNGGVPQGRGRPRKTPAATGATDSAPQGTLGLHRFLFGPQPTGDSLPGKKGSVHKIKDTGTVKNPNAVDTGEFDEGLGDDFAAMARGMKNKDGTPRFTTVRQGPAPIKPPSSKPPGAVRPSGPATTGPEDWYNQSTGGKRNMGDSKINRKAAVTESVQPKGNFKAYLAESAGGQDAFEHILNRYKHEVKQFQSGADMDNDLYEALFDYYLNAGEMPYGVAKARTGDPFEWVAARFDQDNPAMDEAVNPMDVPAVQRKAQGQAPLSLDQVRAPRADSISDPVNLSRNNGTKDLDDLARLAGITTESVSVMGSSEMMGDESQEDKMNISTNQSSDGTKSITVTADGEAAVALLDMLKNAGMGGSDAAAEQEVIIAAQGDEHMGGDEMSMDDGSGEMEMEEEYANEPAPQYQSVEKITSAGDDMNREKKQNFPLRAPGNNPMSETEQVDELSKNTLGSYAKKANDQRAHEPDHMKADRRGTGVMQAIGKIAGGPNKGGIMRGHAAQARFTNANNLPNAAKDAETFNRSVDRNVAKESTDPVQSMGRDLMAEYQAMKIKK
jgi:hypothetical protein